jgi:hypothetical protein
MSEESEQIFTIGNGDQTMAVTISGSSEQDTERIAKAFQELPVELLNNPKLLTQVLEKAALELRRDGKIDAETIINTRRSAGPVRPGEEPTT